MIIPRELRQTVNKAAHIEGQRHEATTKARLMAELEQRKKDGATDDTLREWLGSVISSKNIISTAHKCLKCII